MVRRDLLNAADVDHRAAIAPVRIRFAFEKNVLQPAVVARETQIKRSGGNHVQIIALFHQRSDQLLVALGYAGEDRVLNAGEVFLVHSIADFGDGGNRNRRNVGFCGARGIAQLEKLAATGDQRNRAALFACTTGAPDAVNIVFAVLRNVVVDDVVHVADVDAARRNVGSNQNRQAGRFEAFHNARALRLVHVAVNRFGGESVAVQMRGYLIDHQLRIAEDHASLRVIRVQKQNQRIELSAHRDFH